MKINQNANVTQTGTVDTSQAVQFGFDVSGMGAIAGLLQNMYSDTSLAVLREYFCNAMDSHRAAGVTRPVQVTLPADMNPSLLIQDFGLGLSQHELVTVYSTYGSSTKRESDDAIGGFGIGSKAAFSMAEQFIVTGVKNGEKTVMLFSLGKAGMGEAVTVSHTFDSREANGVTVSIPIRDVAAMERTAAAFFTTWQPGTVLVDGVQPTSIFDGAFAVGDRFHVVTGKDKSGSALSGMTLVMGGVGYPVDAAIRTLAAAGQPSAVTDVLSHLSRHHLLIDGHVGDADITPSREALRDTDRTVEFIRASLIEFAADVRTRVVDHVAQAPTFHEAARRLFSADGVVQFLSYEERKSITWRGHAIRRSVVVPAWMCAQIEHKTNSLGHPTGKSMVRSADDLELRFEDLDTLLVITGVTQDRQWGLIKRKFKAYQTLPHHVSRTKVLAVESSDERSMDWLTWGGPNATVETISYDEYAARVKNAVIIPASERGRFTYYAASSLADATAHNAFGNGLESLPLAELREATELIWMHEGQRRSGLIAATVAVEHPDATWIVLTGAQSASALNKRLPDAVHLERLLAPCARAVVAAATAEVEAELLSDNLRCRAGNSRVVKATVEMLGAQVHRITNPRFLALLEDLRASQQARVPLSQQAALVASALGALGTNARETFGQHAEAAAADDALKADFPLVVCAISNTTHQYYNAEALRTLTDHIVTHINSLVSLAT